MMRQARTLLLASVFICTVLFPFVLRSEEQTPGTPVPPPAQTPEKNRPEQPAAPQEGELALPETGSSIPAPEGTTEEPTPAAKKTAPANEEEGRYVIKQGDTLWDISNTFLKDPFLWPLIWKANTYITNPDLIYPGNKLIIPSLAPIERALEAPAGKAPEERAIEEEAKAAPLPMRPKPKPAQPAPEEAPPARAKIILPEEVAVPIVDKYSMLSAGYVNDEQGDDKIVGSPEPKSIFGYDDIVYVRFDSRDKVNVGEKFLIYVPLKDVKHPESGSSYGSLIKVLGVLQVSEKGPSNVYSGRITLSFDSSEKGNFVTPYQEPILIYDSKKRAKDLSGYVLEVSDRRTLNGQIDVVYLDKGSVDGVEPGDRFIVYVEQEEEDFPRKVVGEVQVVLVKERTATAVVKKSTDVMARGDRIEYKK